MEISLEFLILKNFEKTSILETDVHAKFTKF